MERCDFVLFNIHNFTPKEVTNTRASLKSVKVGTLIRLQRMRTKISRCIHLLKNGLTTGRHKSKLHPQGKAVDVYIKGLINVNNIIYTAQEAGFRGIGVYFCGETGLYTFHFDTGKYRLWGAYKKRKKDKWIYYNIIQDPKGMLCT